MSGIRNKNLLRTNHSVILYKEEITSQLVAQTGIPSDRFHLGKIILQSLKEEPDFTLQIDGALNIAETNRSVMERSVQCAVALKNLGLQRGDVIAVMAPNHIDLAIPLCAAMYLGIGIAGVDTTLGVGELQGTFKIYNPKIVFCQKDKALVIKTALNDNQTHIITFDKGNTFCCFVDFLREYSDNTRVEDFKPTDFDPAETTAFLAATSGTTGLPKAAILTHKNLAISTPSFLSNFTEFPKPTHLYFFLSPLQWLTAGLQFILSPIFRYTRLQTSALATKEHILDLINRYKPTAFFVAPSAMTSLVATGDLDKCDFSCFSTICLGGSQATSSLKALLKTLAPQAEIYDSYGITEGAGLIFEMDSDVPMGSIGRPIGHVQHRLVDPITLENIEDPNIPGELWLNGPTIFKGYYNNPQATQEAFSKDGWYKTGDLFTRNSSHYYFFIDRIKMLLKYRGHQVIRKHHGVHDVVVVGVPEEECGELPTACVVVRAGHVVSAQEIKDLVKENLADTKQLRGGVIFMKELPTTATSKLNRNKLKTIVTKMLKQ